MDEPEREDGPLVVVIDDEKTIADAICRYLRVCGWRVRAFTDAFAGLEAVLEDPPFALITDVAMPGLDGLELVRHVRRALGEARPHTMFISANLLDHAERELADAYFEKPFRVSAVEEALARWSAPPGTEVGSSGTRLKRPVRRGEDGGRESGTGNGA